MKWLGRVLLVAVLLSLLVTPVFALGSQDSSYVSVSADTDVGNFSLYEYVDSGGSYKDFYVYTPSFYCENYDPAFDLDEMVKLRGNGVVEIDVAFPSSECDYSWGTLPDTISLDVTLTANTIYHGTWHENVVKGDGPNRNCQEWRSYDVEATGTIAGSPISETFWGGISEQTCRNSGK